MMMSTEHSPVLLTEAIAALNLKPGTFIIDGTFGRGGHSRLILEQIGSDGRLLALDRDSTACVYGRQLFEHDARFRIEHAAFEQLTELLTGLGYEDSPIAILLDIGVSSSQLEDARRGFSFRMNGPLDMRLDPGVGQSAAEWLNTSTMQEIAFTLKNYGEEKRATAIARAIVRTRARQPIATTEQLATLVAEIVPAHTVNKHPATRTFLALRIQVNDELGHLQRGLQAALSVLAPSGRLVVISFHSLEDRIVKRFFRSVTSAPDILRKLPVRQQEFDQYKKGRVLGPVVRPSAWEVARNSRARSAVMRVFEKAA